MENYIFYLKILIAGFFLNSENVKPNNFGTFYRHNLNYA